MDMSGLGGGFRRIYGVVIGIVVDHNHDNGEYRVKVKFPWLRDKTDAGDKEDFLSSWARISTVMAGKDMGFWCLPEKEDEVLAGMYAELCSSSFLRSDFDILSKTCS